MKHLLLTASTLLSCVDFANSIRTEIDETHDVADTAEEGVNHFRRKVYVGVLPRADAENQTELSSSLVDIGGSHLLVLQADYTPEEELLRNTFVRPAEWSGEIQKDAKKLGAGAFGTAFLATARCESTNASTDKVVVKQVVSCTSFPTWDDLSQETRIQARLQHPNVAQVYDWMPRDAANFVANINLKTKRAKLFSIMMETITGGEIFDTMFCKKRGGIYATNTCTGTELPFADTEDRKKYVAEMGKQFLEGIKYLHDEGITHRDLKPQNVMISGTDCVKNPTGCAVKIIDFGLAHKTSKENQGLKGTPYYISPDLYYAFNKGLNSSAGLDTGKKHDVFSAGLMLFTMWHAQAELTTNGRSICARKAVLYADGKEVYGAHYGAKIHPFFCALPFSSKMNPDENYHRIGTSGDFVSMFEAGYGWDPKIPPGLKELIRGMLEIDPVKRFDSTQALNGIKQFWTEVYAHEASPHVVLTGMAPDCINSCVSRTCAGACSNGVCGKQCNTGETLVEVEDEHKARDEVAPEHEALNCLSPSLVDWVLNGFK